MRVGLLYFSGSGMTEKISRFIGRELERQGHDVWSVNLFFDKEKTAHVNINVFDVLIFGFPVYGGRLPGLVEQWLQGLKTGGKNCSVFFTYGGRANENGLKIAYYLLTKSGFNIVLAAEFVAAHTFNVAEGWSLAVDRPNADDFNVVEEFIKLSLKRFSSSYTGFNVALENFHYRSRAKSRSSTFFKPFLPRRNNECSMCLLCERKCPTNAFDAEKGVASSDRCIYCMYCVVHCPDQAITVENVRSIFDAFKERYEVTVENVKRKRSQLFY